MIAETGRVISKRYLLQRLEKQGQICTIYQGTDQILQRTVAVKVVPSVHMPTYRAALRLTAQFSHPNIVGLYDLVPEAEMLYIVQEYVDGDDFATLLQKPLTAYEVADIGCQICSALIYAGSATRKVCHGDLTPAAVTRNPSGLVRLNNFALPSDPHYFASWSSVGGEHVVLSNRELPWGQQSESRREDDTRAAGLLLYQLLAGRPAGASVVEPPADGSLRFLRNTPPELCDTVARAVIRQHPQHIKTPEAFYSALRKLAEAFEPVEPEPPPPTLGTGVAAPPYEETRLHLPQQFSPAGTGKLVTALPIREGGQPGAGLSSYSSRLPVPVPSPDVESAAAPTAADVSLKLATARQAAYPQTHGTRRAQFKRPSIRVLLLLGLLLFVLLFVIGFFGGLSFGP